MTTTTGRDGVVEADDDTPAGKRLGAMVRAIATALGGRAVRSMPGTRDHGVEWERPDGKYVALEPTIIDGGCGYLFPSRASHDRYHRDGFQGTIPDAAEWDHWGDEEWARALAFLLGGQAHHTGGNCWVIFLTLADGRCAVISSDAIGVMPSRESWDTCDPGEDPCCEHHEFWS